MQYVNIYTYIYIYMYIYIYIYKEKCVIYYLVKYEHILFNNLDNRFHEFIGLFGNSKNVKS